MQFAQSHHRLLEHEDQQGDKSVWYHDNCMGLFYNQMLSFATFLYIYKYKHQTKNLESVTFLTEGQSVHYNLWNGKCGQCEEKPVLKDRNRSYWSPFVFSSIPAITWQFCYSILIYSLYYQPDKESSSSQETIKAFFFWWIWHRITLTQGHDTCFSAGSYPFTVSKGQFCSNT